MNGRLSHRSEWSDRLKREMFDLMSAHFVSMTRDQFERDLDNKHWAVLVEDDASRLVGFSTLALYHEEFRGRTVHVLCSGDTIVDRLGGQPPSTALLRCWIQSVERLKESHALEPLYWLLLVSGFRTYRFLPVFWRSFVPRRGQAIDDMIRDLMNHLATRRFGSCFNPATGIVRFEQPQVLRRDLNGVPANRLRDPHIAFFHERNPGHERGDELVCLARLCRSNLTAAGLRMLLAQRQLLCTGT